MRAKRSLKNNRFIDVLRTPICGTPESLFTFGQSFSLLTTNRILGVATNLLFSRTDSLPRPACFRQLPIMVILPQLIFAVILSRIERECALKP